MGLIRKVIILGGIVLALPSPPVTQQMAGQPMLQSSTFATLAAAADTVADFKGFCARRPQACVTGQYIAYTLEAKAKYTARMLYEWASPGMPPEQTQVAAHVSPEKPHLAPGVPALRLASFTEPKPTKIEDLLRSTSN